MGKILVIENPKQVAFHDYEEKVLTGNEIRVKTLYSGISAGTQLTLYRGQNPLVHKKFNSEKRLYLDRKSDDPKEEALYPAKGAWGYEEVGEVIEVGAEVTQAKIGDVIFGQWGHRSTHIITEEYYLSHKMPVGLDPMLGIFAQMGAISLNAILDADIHVGENVAVFGQGVPGQIVSQLARLNGATVFAVDMSDTRLALSKKLGAEYTFNPKNCDVGLEIKTITEIGADKSIEISGVAKALHEAIRTTAYNGRVVCAGFLVEPATDLCLGAEFHLNRINIVGSQIENVNPAVSHIWNFMRKQHTILALAQSGKLDLKSLISHVIPFEEGADAYHMLDTSTECMQVILKFC